MGPRPAVRLAASVRGRPSTKSWRLQRTRIKRIELESVVTLNRRCSPSMTWMRRTSRSGSTSWSSQTRRRRKLQADQITKIASPAPSNLITKFARILTEKEEQRLRQEKAREGGQPRQAEEGEAGLQSGGSQYKPDHVTCHLH